MLLVFELVIKFSIVFRTLSASDFCLVYDPVSFANTVVKKKKWLSGSRDCDVFGDYYVSVFSKMCSEI